MTNSRKLIVQVVGDSSKLDRTLRGTESRLKKFGRKASGGAGGGGGGLLGGGVLLGGVGKAGAVGAAAAAGMAIAYKGIKRVTDAAEEAEIAQANLGQAFDASGLSAAKFGKQVDAAIQATSKLSAFDDEDVSASFASLLRTTGSIAKATRDSALAANIARARRISLASATKIVEKAENSQLRGLKAVGVEITKNMTATEAIEAAQRKFAGSAERYGNTAAGAQDKYRVALENVEERIGAKLLPLQTKLALGAVRFLDWAEANWPRFAKAIEDAFGRVKPFFDNSLRYYKALAAGVAGMVKIVHGIFTGDWAEAWAGMKQYAVDGVLGILKAVAWLPAKIGAAITKKAFAGLSKVGSWIKDAVVGGLEGLVSGITSAIREAVATAFDIIQKLVDAANKSGSVINKVLPKRREIPRIPDLPNLRATGSGGRATPRDPQAPLGPSGPLVVKLVVDGREMNTVLTPHRQQAQGRNPAQRRGPNAGRVAG